MSKHFKPQVGKTLLYIMITILFVGISYGAFTDSTRLDVVFKHGQYVGWSSTDKAYYEETTAWDPFVHGDNVWLANLTNFTNANTTGLVIEHVKITMEEDLTVSDSRAWFNTTEFPTGGCVPASFNQSYTVKIYESDDTQIFLSDAADPFFEYETCRLSFQDSHSFSTPIKITVFTYNGSVLGNASLDHGGLSGLSDDDHPQYLTRTDSVSYYVNRSDWTTIDNYPSDCSAGNAVTGLGDTLSCDSFDNYVDWDLYTDGSKRDDITTGEAVGFDSGTGIDVSWDGSRDVGFGFDCSDVAGTNLSCDGETLEVQDNWVNSSGDNMTGELNMTSNNISGVDCILFNSGGDWCSLT